MNPAGIEREIHELLNEDFYGLWEIGWRVHTAFGIDPMQDPVVLAEVVASLQEKRIAELYVRERGEEGPVPIAVSGHSVDLTQPVAWAVPEPHQPQILLGRWEENP